jgi:branched-chain amino acid transport system substrate-binding protein
MGTLMILPSSTASEISSLDDSDLVWRTAPPDTYQADTLAYYATWQILERFGGEEMAPSGGQAQFLTFASAYSEDIYGAGLYSEFRARLLSNLEWLTLNSLQPAIRFVTAPYDSTDPSSLDSAIDALISSEPDIALVVGYEETADIFEAVRDDEVARSAAYFVTDGVRSAAVRTLFDSPEEKPEFLFGVTPTAREGAAFEAFEASYLETYGGAVLPVWTEHAYDATYLLAYAFAGSPESPTGGDLAEAMKRAVDLEGRSVRVGTEDFLAATTEMGSGGTLLVEGASGLLDLDPAVGDRQTAEVLRWDIDTEVDAYQDCGVATSYSTAGIERDWCAARCMEEAEDCTPDVFVND